MTQFEWPQTLGVEFVPRLFTWETYYPEWGEDVRSAVYLPGRSVALIDPLVPAGRSASLFWKTLDYLVLEERLPLRVLLTVFWHERSAPAIAARYPTTRVWCPSGGSELSTSARRFHPGVRLPAGIRALPTARRHEVLLWIERAHVLLAGDVILGGKRRPLRLCPRGWLPEEVSPADLADSIAPVLDLPIGVVHSGHGPPVTTNAREALSSALKTAGARV